MVSKTSESLAFFDMSVFSLSIEYYDPMKEQLSNPYSSIY